MFKVYKILSDEYWNGQNKPSDFEKTEWVADFDTLQETLDFIGDADDLIYEEV